MDGSQKLPQRLLDPVQLHLRQGDSYRRLTLGIAGRIRYVSGIDEKGNPIEVVDLLAEQSGAIYQHYLSTGKHVRALLVIDTISGWDLRNNTDFIEHVTAICQQLHSLGTCTVVAALSY